MPCRSVHATPDERTRVLPGDDLIPQAIDTLTHGITIRRAPDEVWRWLVQMGAGSRAGWYSYDWIDNGRQPSATRIVPELQHPAVGTIFPALPGIKEGFKVLALEHERVLTLGWLGPDGTTEVTWTFVLDRVSSGVTRLVVRARGGPGYRFHGLPLPLTRLVVRVIHFIMQRKQLLGIADRAETTRPSTFLARHAITAYFALTFAISWTGVLLVIGGPAGMTSVKAQDNTLFAFAVLAMVAGPSLTGILLTALIDGRSGLREFRSRLLAWRVGSRWYAVALLAAPLLTAATTLILSLVSPQFLPAIIVSDDKAAVLLLGLIVAVTAGFFEELGWTGFAIPRLTCRYGFFLGGAIVGVMWSAWHLLVVVWGIGDRAGTVPLALYVFVDTFSFLTAFRILMVWVYDRTESLFVGMLMHASLTASTLILWPLTKGLPLLGFDFAVTAVMCVGLVAAAMANYRRRSSRSTGPHDFGSHLSRRAAA